MGQNLCCCCKRDRNNMLYEPLLQESEREAVSDLLRYLETRNPETQLFSDEALRALTTLSYSQNIDLQRSAALAFAEITERQVQEVDATVLDPLLHLLRSSTDVEVQRASSAALGNLAVAVTNKVKIVRLGGLAPLISQMTSPNVEVQCNAVGTICNLATHEENKASIARSGALGPLVRLSRNSRDLRVMRNATGALLNMTHSEENRRELVDCGAIPVLAYLLHQHNLNKQRSSGDVDVVYYCTTAISNLAVDAVNRRKLQAERLLVTDLVELLGPSNQTKLRCQAALSLRNLASDESYQIEIAAHEKGLERLHALLTSNSSDKNALVLASVACIRNISIHPHNEIKIINAGFLEPLVALMGSSAQEEARCHAISTLRNLAAGSTESDEVADNNRTLIIESGAMEAIKALIDASVSEQVSWPVLSEATACLAVLALSDTLKPYLLDMNIIQSLLLLLADEIKTRVPAEVQGNAAATIGNLATKCSNLKYFTADSATWNGICAYIERFMTGALEVEEYESGSDIGATYQHIAIWTILQLVDKDTKKEGYSKLMSLLQNKPSLLQQIQKQAAITSSDSYEDEIVTLARKVLSIAKG